MTTLSHSIVPFSLLHFLVTYLHPVTAFAMAQDNGARPGQLPDVVQPPQIPANLPGQIEALMGEMRRQREREENRDRGRPHPVQMEADPLLGADQHGVPPGPPNLNNRRRIEVKFKIVTECYL